TNVPEFSPFSSLVGRLGTNWKLAAIAITVVLFSGLMTAATLRIRHAKAAAVVTPPAVISASTSLTPTAVSEAAAKTENPAPSESTSAVEKTEAAAPAATEGTQVVDLPESQFEPRIVSSVSSTPRPLPRRL